MEYKKSFFGKTSISSSDCDEKEVIEEIELEYYETRDFNEENKREYGIEVVKKIMKDERFNIESKIVNNISNEEIKNVLKSIKELPVQIDKLLNQQYCEQYKEIAETLYDKNDIFFIGRGIDYALCMEGSLKLKEISYIHSEAYAAGELKHGTISLIEPGTPVIGVITDERRADKTLSNIEETGSRGSDNYMIITDELDNIYSKSNENYNKYKKIVIPKTHKLFQPLLTVVPLQMIAYETAKLKGEEIDTPRNLAKAVTVE